MRGFLHREHDADAVRFVGALDIGGIVDAEQDVGMGGQEAVPAGIKAQSLFVIPGAAREGENVDAGSEIGCGFGGHEGFGMFQQAIALSYSQEDFRGSRGSEIDSEGLRLEFPQSGGSRGPSRRWAIGRRLGSGFAGWRRKARSSRRVD